MRKLLIFGIMMLMLVASVSADYTIRPDIASDEVCFNGGSWFESVVIDQNLGTYMSGPAGGLSSLGCGDVSNMWLPASPDNFASATALTLRFNMDYTVPGCNELDGCAVYLSDGHLRVLTDPSAIVFGPIEPQYAAGYGYNGGWEHPIPNANISQQWYEVDVTDFIDELQAGNLLGFVATGAQFNWGGAMNYGTFKVYEFELLVTEAPSNTAPVINEIIPDERVELKNGETQLYSADVTDTEADASYSWTIGAVEVSTSETYLADWSDIEPGIYTLTLTVDDGEFQDSASVTLEIRAKGGGSGEIASGFTVQQQEVTQTQYKVTSAEQKGFFARIWDWFRGLF